MIRSSLAVLCLVVSSSARANPNADKLAADAKEAAVAGNFKGAAELFAKAYKEDPSLTNAFCNIGVSYWKAGELPRAHLLLTLCVQRATLELAVRDNANAVIVSIEEQLRAGNHTPVTISVRPNNVAVTLVEFGEESQFGGARTVWLPFGSHRIEAKLAGYQDMTTTVETKDQAPKSVELALDKLVVVTPPPPPVVRRPSTPSKIPPIATSVATVGAGLLAVIAFSKARTSADRANAALDAEAFGVHDGKVTRANTLFAVGVGGFVIGAAASSYLWYRATKSRATTLEATPTAGGAAVRLGRRF